MESVAVVKQVAENTIVNADNFDKLLDTPDVLLYGFIAWLTQKVILALINKDSRGKEQ